MRIRNVMVAVSLLTAAACSQQGKPAEAPQADQLAMAEDTISELERADPGIATFFNDAYGYVVFPAIGKGGLLVGGAHGTGWVYERGRLVGQAKMTEVSVGAQAGGQRFAEVIFFRDPASLEAFKRGETKLGAEVSAVILEEGAAKKAGYNPSGLAVFVMPKGGAMAAASVGGQRFSYQPIT